MVNLQLPVVARQRPFAPIDVGTADGIGSLSFSMSILHLEAADEEPDQPCVGRAVDALVRQSIEGLSE